MRGCSSKSPAPVAARVEAEALETALEHLIDIALEAIGPDGRVTLGLERRDRWRPS